MLTNQANCDNIAHIVYSSRRRIDNFIQIHKKQVKMSSYKLQRMIYEIYKIVLSSRRIDIRSGSFLRQDTYS